LVENINNWNQSAQTQNGLFHCTSSIRTAFLIQHVLNQNAMTQTMVSSGVSLSIWNGFKNLATSVETSTIGTKGFEWTGFGRSISPVQKQKQ
jgi:hypothetical protein